MRIFLPVIVSLTLSLRLLGQPINDNCNTAFHLPNTQNWCSEPGQYTNVNATPSITPVPVGGVGCFLNAANEVWFTFQPQTPAMYIKVTGAAQGIGTLKNPGIGVFRGPCPSLTRVGCNLVSNSVNVVELSVESLIIGETYYLIVEGINATGTFQVCLNGFFPPPNPQSDCGKAVVLCDKSPFVVDTLLGIGTPDPGVTGTCVQQELSSAWYKWTCDQPGTLEFTLTPNGFIEGFESDDIDFVVYELPDGINNCATKKEIRCMASGANVGQPFQNWKRCNGPTGLTAGDPDVTEPPGCQLAGQNNFVNAINMEAGKSYALMINNFSQSGLGFSIQWGGTGTFQGPEPGFDVTAVQAFECDKTIIFDNQSEAPTDSIVEYLWNFGAGANPTFGDTAGPYSVVYESFGPKKVALTVTSEKGCVVTEIVDFYIEPCCADTSTLGVTASVQDQICPGTASGFIQGIGFSGAPEYQYSLDCITYQPASVFPALLPGNYTLCIQDEKGCKNQVDLTLLPATGFGVEAGDTLFVQLGNDLLINAVATPNLPSSVTWNNLEHLQFNGMSILDSLNPTALPITTDYYVVTITNDAGCVDVDSVLIIVDPFKPIYIPNVISANQDNVNDFVTAYGNNAATGIELFQVFDRWGNMLWEAQNTPLMLNEPSLGWNGTTKDGRFVNPGVYTYVMRIQFLDLIPVVYTGDITVLR